MHSIQLLSTLPIHTASSYTSGISFREQFPNTASVINCSETEHHQIPGLHCTMEEGAGDKSITANTGFLAYLCPGNEVMSARGFIINDLLYKRIHSPAMRLSEEDTTSTRRIM
ncbi:hypothetical protein QQF64_036193 [Cirrhinus molitorella]|uniref:Uncharacterized protein n=1 Tax=Cirrhinus molitorella TaxID=172907 RepID=A0ABR3NHV1_9TELE